MGLKNEFETAMVNEPFSVWATEVLLYNILYNEDCGFGLYNISDTKVRENEFV